MDSLNDLGNAPSAGAARETAQHPWPDLAGAFTQIKEGDQAEFERLLPHIHATAWPIIRWILKDSGYREEALQDTDFRVFVYIKLTPTVPEPVHFERLVKLIAKQRSLDIVKKNRRWWDKSQPLEGVELGIPPAVGDPAPYKILQECVQGLPERQRQALRLWRLGYSHSEIAETLDASEDAVRNLINHGKATLRNFMQERLSPRQGA